MAAPFYAGIKGSSSGTAGTGAFTPTTAPSGYRAWSNVPTGWIGLVRYEDGTAWELTYSYWNGTTLSRASTQVVESSTGSQLTLTSAAFAGMVLDPREVQPHIGGTAWRGYSVIINSTSGVVLNAAAFTVTGTAAAAALATTNYMTEQARLQVNSATTASAQAGLSTTTAFAVYSTTAGRGGFEFVVRFGAAQLPTGPRLFAGLTSSTMVGSSEPSAVVASVAAFGKDSTDTNIQLLVNSNSGGGTKTDTGIALVATGWYEATVWAEPGGGTIYGLLIRLDTGAIWFGSTTTDIPANGALLFPQLLGGLNATNTGTAFQLTTGTLLVRTGT